jgi:hypothetical protein
VPTIPKLLPIIKKEIYFHWGRKSLERIVKSLEFKWRKCQSKRKILIERADTVDWRSRYLVKIKEYREKGHPIFYFDESWVDSNLTFRKYWQNKEVMGVQANMNSGNRLIMLHVGGIMGFFLMQHLFIRLEVKWAVEELIPYLPVQSVIVLDNAPYHCL